MLKIKNIMNIEVTNPEKVIFPEINVTKLMVVEYYYQMASAIYFLTKDHILTMERYPQGVHKEGFWHKNCPDFFPEWIEKFHTKKEDGDDINYIVISDKKIFPFVAAYYSIVNHIWTSTFTTPHQPDRIIFDLDPSKKNDFKKVQKVAAILKDVLDRKNINSFVMTTGSRGLHVVVPIHNIYSNDQVKIFAQHIAKEVVNNNPELTTLEIRKEKRDNKIFIDILRNNYAQTAIAPYSLRSLPNAPVATPISWDEAFTKDLRPDRYDIFTAFEHSKTEPWKNFYKNKNKLKTT